MRLNSGDITWSTSVKCAITIKQRTGIQEINIDLLFDKLLLKRAFGLLWKDRNFNYEE